MRKFCFCAGLLFLCGCFKIKDELTIQADGSGTVTIETQLPGGSETRSELMAARMEGSGAFYPPTSEDEAKTREPQDHR